MYCIDESVCNTTLNHTYEDVGEYCILIWASNDINTESTTVCVFVDVPITNIDFSFNSQEEGIPATFQFEMDSGTNIYLVFQYGDGVIEEKFCQNYTCLTVYSHTYNATECTVYNLTVYVSNSLSVHKFESEIAHSESIDGLYTCISSPAVSTEYPNVTIARTITKGCHVVCAWIFGDNTAQLTYEEKAENTTNWHLYDTVPGAYDFKLSCYNYLGYFIYISQEILVQIEIHGPGFVIEGDLWYELDHVLTFHLNGTNATCSVYIDGVDDSANVSYEGSVDGPSNGTYRIQAEALAPGEHELVLNCTNALGTHIFNSTVINIVTAEITHLEVCFNSPVSSENSNVTFSQTKYTGLDMYCGRYLGDNQLWIVYNSDSNTTFTHLYNSVGCYTFVLKCYNLVSYVVYIPNQVCVLDPITFGTFNVTEDDSGTAVLWYELDNSLPFYLETGTNATCTVQLDGVENNTLLTYNPQEKEISHGSLNIPAESLVAGQYAVDVNCTNELGTYQFNQTLSVVEAKITNLSVCHNGPVSSDNPYVNFTQTLSGRDVYCGRYLGDRHLTIVFNAIPDSTTNFSHLYASVGCYDFILKCYNAVNYVMFTIEDICVYDPINGTIYNGSEIVELWYEKNNTIPFDLSSGTNATCNVQFDGIDANESLSYIPAETGQTSGYVEFPAKSVSVGNHTLNINCTNALGTFQFKELVIDIVQGEITGLAGCSNSPASSDYANVTFNQSIFSGREMYCGRYFGDEELWIVYDIFPDLSVTFSHVYPAVGCYDFMLKCYNDVTHVMFLIEDVCILDPITGPGFVYDNIEDLDLCLEKEYKLPFSLTTGNYVNCTVQIDDVDDNGNLNYTSVVSEGSNGTYLIPEMSLSLGPHTTDLTCANDLGSYQFNRTIINIVKCDITNLSVSFDCIVSTENNNITFIRTMTSGRAMTCGIYFGDDYVWIVHNKVPDMSTTFWHVYPSIAACYDFTVHCYNDIRYILYVDELCMQIPIDGKQIDNDLLNVIYESDIYVAFEINNGTNATCSAKLDYVDKDVIYNMVENGPSNGTYLHNSSNSGPLALGKYELLITCSNLVSNYTFNKITINVMKQIQNLTVTPLDMIGDAFYITNELVTFDLNATDGSNVTFYIDFADGNGNQTIVEHSLEGPYHHQLTITFLISDSYIIKVVAVNSVSTASATVEVICEHPVPDFTLTVTNVSDISDSITVRAIHPGAPAPDPDSTQITCDFTNDGNSDIVENIEIGDSVDFTTTYISNVFGDFIATCNISNNVSSKNALKAYRVGVEIEGFGCEIVNPSNLSIEIVPTFVFHFDKGSNLTVGGCLKNQTECIQSGSEFRRENLDWDSADDITINPVSQQFTEPPPEPTADYYRAEFSACNVFSCSVCTIDYYLFEPVTDVTFSALIKHEVPNVQITFQTNAATGSKLEVEYNFDDGINFPLKLFPDRINGGIFVDTDTRAYANDICYSPCVTVSNIISSLTVCDDVCVEYPVPNNMLHSATNITYLGDEVIFTFTVPDGLPVPTSVKARIYYFSDNINNTVGSEDDIDWDIPFPYVKPLNVYNEYGDYESTFCLCNNVSCECFDTSFRVGVEMQGCTCEKVHQQYMAVDFNCHVDQGSTVVYEIICNNNNPDIVLQVQRANHAWNESDNALIRCTYSRGDQSVTARYRCVNNTYHNKDWETWRPLFDVNENVTGTDLVLDGKKCAIISTEIQFTVNVWGGTNIASYVDLGNGQRIPASNEVPNKLSHEGFQAADHPVFISYSGYPEVNNYSAVAHSIDDFENHVISETIYFVRDNNSQGSEILIQQYVEAVRLFTNITILSSVGDPIIAVGGTATGVVKFFLSNNAPVRNEIPPTDLHCKFKIPTGSDSTFVYKDIYAGGLTIPIDFEQIFPSNIVGTHIASVNCSNCVSYAVSDLTLHMQQQIQRGQLTATDVVVQTGDPFVLTVSAASGSNCTIIADIYGRLYDPNGERIVRYQMGDCSEPYTLNHTLTHEEQYLAANLTVDILLKNDISDQHFTQDIWSQNRITEGIISVSVSNPVRCLGDVCPVECIIESHANIDTPNIAIPDNVFLLFDDNELMFFLKQQIISGGELGRKQQNLAYQAETINIHVNASNMVSYILIPVSITLVRPVTDCALDRAGTNRNAGIEIGELITFHGTVSKGTNITYIFYIDNQEINTYHTYGEGASKDFSHQFNTVGNFTLHVACINSLSDSLGPTTSSNMYLSVQRQISSQDISIQCQESIALDAESAEMEDFLLIVKNSGNSAPTDVSARISFETKQSEPIRVTEFPFELPFRPYVYPLDPNANPIISNANPIIYIVLSNQISTLNLNCSTQIVTKVAGLEVTVENNTISTGVITYFRVVLTHGTYFNITAVYCDEAQEQVSFNYFQDIINLNHTFHEAKSDCQVIITAQSSRLLIESTVPLSVTVQLSVLFPVPAFSLANNTRAHEASNEHPYNIIVQPVVISTRYPTNAIFKVYTLGTTIPIGKTFDENTGTLDSPVQIMLPQPGNYTIVMEISNPLNRQVLYFEIIVATRIAELQASIKDYNNPALEYSNGTNIPVGAKVRLTAHSLGTNVQYHWEILKADHTPTNINFYTEEASTTLNLPVPIVIKLTARNAIGSISTYKFHTIISDIEIVDFDYDTRVTIGEICNFTIITKKELSDACFEVTLSANSSSGVLQHNYFWLGTNRELCENNNDNFEISYYKEISVGNIRYTYGLALNQEGDYSVDLKTITPNNPGSPIRWEARISVQEVVIQCNIPVITLIQQSGTGSGSMDNPIMYFKENQITTPSKGINVEVKCEVTQNYNEEWKLYSVSADGELTSLSVTDDYKIVKGNSMTFPAMSMNYGLYAVTVNVSMENLPKFSSILEFYFEVQRSDLVIGLTSYIRIGPSEPLEIDAVTLVYDPDVGILNKEGLVYTWICGLELDSITENDLIADKIPIPTADATVDGKTFCSENNAGILDTSSGILTLFTGHMEGSKNYTLVLRVTKDIRVAMVSINIEVVAGNPPKTTYSCFEPNKAIPICGKKSVSTTKDSYFLISCASCDPGEVFIVVFQITITTNARRRRRNTITDAIIAVTEQIQMEDGSILIKIPAGSLPLGESLLFRFIVKSEGREDGIIEKTIKTNGRPSTNEDPSFSLSFVPEEGDKAGVARALATRVTFSPHGWQAFEAESSLTYTFEVCYDFTAQPEPLDCINKTNTVNTFFSKKGLEKNGNKTAVRLYVTDTYSTSTMTDFIEVTVLGAAEGAADALLADIESGGTSNALVLLDMIATVTNAVEVSDDATTEEDNTDNSVVDSGTDTGNTDVSAGSDQYLEQTAAQQEEKERQAAEQAEQQAKAAVILTSMIQTMISFAKPADDDEGGSSSMTQEQIMMTIATTAALAKKMKTTQQDASQSGSLDLMNIMSSSFATLSIEDQPAAAQGLFSVAGSVLDTVPSEPIIVITAQDPNAVPDEAALEEEQRLAAEKAEKAQEQSLGALSKVDDSVSQIFAVMSSSMELDTLVVIEGDSMKVSFQKTSGDTIGGQSFEGVNGGVQLPQNISTAGDIDLLFKMIIMQTNVYSWSEDTDYRSVNTGVTQIEVTDDSGSQVAMGQFSDPVSIYYYTQDAEHNYADLTNVTRDSITNMVYFHIAVEQNNSAYINCLHPQDPDVRFGFYFKFNESVESQMKPNKTEDEHDLSIVQNGYVDQFCIVVPQEYIYTPGFFIGIDIFYDNGDEYGNDTIPFNMNSVVSRCRAWDDENSKWVHNKCKVGERSTPSQTECLCSEISPKIKNFAAGITIPKVNKIDFKNVFSNFTSLLAANPTVFSVILGILTLYAIIGVWARHRDKKDVEKWGVSPLIDNKKGQDVFYKISIFTGLRQNAGTKSKVCFILSGDMGDTGVRLADDGSKKLFTRGSVRHFVMSTDFKVGTPTFMRIWHDNSGEGADANWFLDKIVVENLTTKERYFFFCSCWLAADEGDGQVDRMIPMAGTEELEDFGMLFFSKTRQKITDDHLFVSIVSRPTKSSFTRVQRLTCCVSLLFTTMIANAMFFRTSSESEVAAGEPDTKVVIGPIILSVNTVLVSIFSSLVVFPVTLIIVQFFRKSKPLHWQDEDEEELQEVKDKTKKVKKQSEGAEAPKPKKKKQRIWKRKYPLPHFCIYIAWVLAVLSIIVPAFFVILYSLDWGETKSLEWMSSLLFSFAQSVVLIQPIKIVFLAAVLSLLFKTMDELDDDKSNKETNAKPLEGEKLDEIKLAKLTSAPISYIPKPPSKSKLERARKTRIFEKKMWGIVKEVTFYFLFLILLSFIAWGNKDDVIFKMNQHVRNIINQGEGGEEDIKGDEVLSGHDYWEWLNTTAIPSIFYDSDYNGKPTVSRERGYMSDMTSYRVGAIRLRQQRVTAGACEVPKVAQGIIMECNEPYSMRFEETKNFSIGWEIDANASYIGIDDISRREKSFIYYDMFDLKGIPYWAWMGTYGGGGYVAELGTSSYQSHKLIAELLEDSWIDYYTRAVFLEFTIYNPSLNLFAFVNYLMEFPATGAVIPSERITSFQVYSVVGGVGAGIIAAQLVYCIIVIYFIVREIIKMKNEKRNYLKEPWNYIEVGIIISSVVAAAMYAIREKFGRIIMAQLAENKEAYTNYGTLAVYNENIDYFVGLLVFLASLKFLRLLRFNRHVNDLAAVFRVAGKDLIYFSITIFIVIMAFGMWGYIIFGKTLFTFSTYTYTLETMLSMLIGKFDLNEMDQADRYLGKPYFVLFTLVIFFVLVNMFLGILTMAYEEVRGRPINEFADHKVIEFFVKKFKKLFHLRVKATEQGEGFLADTDVIQMRLTAIDQHISNMYKESIQPKNDSINALMKKGGKPSKVKLLFKKGKTPPSYSKPQKMYTKTPAVYKKPKTDTTTTPEQKDKHDNNDVDNIVLWEDNLEDKYEDQSVIASKTLFQMSKPETKYVAPPPPQENLSSLAPQFIPGTPDMSPRVVPPVENVKSLDY